MARIVIDLPARRDYKTEGFEGCVVHSSSEGEDAIVLFKGDHTLIFCDQGSSHDDFLILEKSFETFDELLNHFKEKTQYRDAVISVKIEDLTICFGRE